MTRLIVPTAQQPVGFDDLVKTAGVRLSADARLWSSEIVAQVAASHPFLPVEDLTVEFNRLDPIKGAAVGSVKVGETGVAIPVVVKRSRMGSDPELSPTDIFYADGRYQPLTPETVKSAMQSREFGEPLDKNERNRATGGNPYIGDLTGDASPMEFAGQGGPFGPSVSKTAGLDPKKLPDAAKGAVMGALAFGGHRAMRDLELANMNAARAGKSLTAKDKARAIAKGVGTGAAVGAVAGGVGTAAAKGLGLESPFMRKRESPFMRKRAGVEAPSVKELSEELGLEKTASRGDAWGYVGQKATEAGKSKHIKSLLEAVKKNPTLRNAVVGGTVGAGMGAIDGASSGGGGRAAARGAVRGGAFGAAGSAAATKLHQKLGSVCEELVKNAQIHPNDLSNFRALIATNPQLLQGATVSNLRVLDLLLKHKAPGAAVPGTKVTSPNVMILMRDPLTGMTRVKFTGGPVEAVRSDNDLKSMLGSRYTEAKRVLDSVGAYVIADNINQVSWSAARQDQSGAKPVMRDGVYAVRDKLGGTVVGTVALQMFRLNGRSVPMRLLVTSDGRYAISPEMFGVRVGDSNRLPASKAKRGDHGVFVTYVSGTPLPSTPVIVNSVVAVTEGDFVVYNITDPVTGDKVALIPSRTVQNFVRVKDINQAQRAVAEGNVYLMPADVEFVRFAGVVDVAKSADQIVKISEHMDAAMGTNVAFIDGGFHITQGDGVWADLEAEAAAEVLAGMGVVKAEDIVDIQKQAQALSGESLTLRGLHAPELTAANVEVIEPLSTPALDALIRDMRPGIELMKSAAASGNDQALDVVLGLNFITPQNVRLFTDSIEQFDEVASKLASLLLASRLGLQHVREDAVKEAMEGVSRTGEQLRLLQSASEFKRNKQAHGT